MKNKVLGVWKKTQPYRRPFLVLVAIYTIAIVAILRANITYLEDTRRTIEGNKWADIGDFGRFGADFLLTLLGANSTLHDISPLPQLFAIILLAISSIIIVRILSSGKKVRYLPLLASIPIALSPFFCRALLYKFDSVSMAASILFSVLPFLWHKDTKKFAIASVLGTIGMCITYQGSSGVFIIIALALSFREFLFDDKKLKDIARFLGVAAVAFLIGLIVFQFAILPLANLGYRSTEMLSISDFVPGVIRNTRTYFAAIWYGLGDLWRFGMIAMFLCFVAVTTICAKNKLLAFCLACVLLGTMAIASQGAYIALSEAPTGPAASYGFGVMLGIVGVLTATQITKGLIGLLALPGLYMSYSFAAFCLMIGNGIADQQRYDEFRTQMVMQDLNELFPDTDHADKLQIKLVGEIGYTGVAQNIIDDYPIAAKLVPMGLSESWIGYEKLLRTYSYGTDYYAKKAEDAELTNDAELVKTTYYHDILVDQDVVFVVLK